ncbi:hypothetical protein NSIN_20003 [Nitrosotalea sinensis]|uniref:Uncharacterized protein n=1 Tax=Nitrosotalea sinensis TaxID=1499975 RepID=A0A2H1EEN4_9ARCH|nr:hypothetical protein NSIN_20003 [Candidatus Nitrosotalea sinensis]
MRFYVYFSYNLLAKTYSLYYSYVNDNNFLTNDNLRFILL